MTITAPSSHHEPDKQRLQDRIWNHYQVHDLGQFDLSYPRLDFLASCFKRGQCILNIGVGNGYLEEQLVMRGIDVRVLDPSQKTLVALRERIPLEDKGCVGYCQAMPFTSGYLDGVIMTEVLEHLTDDALKQTLKEVYRVLKHAGVFIGTVPYREDITAHQVICPSCHSIFHRWGHHQSFDREKMTNLLQAAEFRIIKAYPRAFPDWQRKNIKFLLKATGRYILGRLGESIVSPNLYFKAQKSCL